MKHYLSAYIQAALFASTDDSGEPLDRNFTSADIAPNSLAKMEKDCAAFLERAKPLIDADPDGSITGAMHDFWLTRNGHGAGFWDGDWQEGDALTKIAKSFGESDLYIGDDGKLHVSP